MKTQDLIKVVAAVVICAVVLAGCSTGSGASSAQSTSSSSTATTSAQTSSASSENSSSVSSDASSSASSTSSESAVSDDDFDRIVVGAWKIYSMETTKGDVKKVGPELMSVLRDYGLHENLTFFHDGTFQIDRGRGDVSTLNWKQVGYNELELEGMLDDPIVQGDEGEGKIVNAKIASGKMTLQYDDSENGTVKLVYVKQ